MGGKGTKIASSFRRRAGHSKIRRPANGHPPVSPGNASSGLSAFVEQGEGTEFGHPIWPRSAFAAYELKAGSL